MKKCVIFDIDGTLANNQHRVHFIKQEYPDWKSFLSNEEMEKDSPRYEIINILKKCENDKNVQVIFLTGRNHRNKETTIQWLNKHIGERERIIITRPDTDYSSAVEFKERELERLIKEGYDVTDAFDDDRSIITMFAEKGIKSHKV